ncbi:hypothetical protein GGI12_000329 [Dipsacomyces acuminosporus]|nr:hypothetical protein GGI12_000329 [Dipsacomyces acuminosporus]
MASFEEPYDYTQPTQPFEETTQVTQDDTQLVTSRQKPAGKLVWKRGEQITEHDVFLDTPVVVGRHRSCHIQVTSSVSSNRHCQITATVDKETKEYLVICEDLSSNGTFWNCKKIGKGKSVILSHGDVLEIKKGHYFTYLQVAQRQSGGKGESQIDSKYQITDTVLGKGTFAEIRLVHRTDEQTQLAVKIMEKRNFSLRGTAEGGANYIHEINLLRGIKHPNIVRVFDVAETSRHVYIFMPLLRGGDLFDYIIDHQRLDEAEAKFIIYQVLLALKYLHDANIAHRDLKPENTLLVSKKPYSQVMLTDFGMAKAAGQQNLMKTMCGTLQYIAPEMISSGVRPGQALKVGYSKAVDCWSLGVMIYAMVSGMLPFSDDEASPQTLFSQILSGHIDFSYPCWRTIGLECQSFIYNLLRINPDKRMSVDQAFDHTWIKKDQERLAKLYADCVRNGGEVESATPVSGRAPSPAAGKTRRQRVDDEDDEDKDEENRTATGNTTKSHGTGTVTGTGKGAGAMGPPPAKRPRPQS